MVGVQRVEKWSRFRVLTGHSGPLGGGLLTGGPGSPSYVNVINIHNL
jgi:hypothetical protein